MRVPGGIPAAGDGMNQTRADLAFYKLVLRKGAATSVLPADRLSLRMAAQAQPV